MLARKRNWLPIARKYKALVGAGARRQSCINVRQEAPRLKGNPDCLKARHHGHDFGAVLLGEVWHHGGMKDDESRVMWCALRPGREAVADVASDHTRRIGRRQVKSCTKTLLAIGLSRPDESR